MKSITVKGNTYRYKVGKTYTRFDTGLVVPNWQLAGMPSPDVFERGQWKRTSDGMITPKRVADYLEQR